MLVLLESLRRCFCESVLSGRFGRRVRLDLHSAPWQSLRASGKPIEEFCSTHGTKAQNYWIARVHGCLDHKGISSNNNELTSRPCLCLPCTAYGSGFLGDLRERTES